MIGFHDHGLWVGLAEGNLVPTQENMQSTALNHRYRQSTAGCACCGPRNPTGPPKLRPNVVTMAANP
jgi:hypothetical protein